MLFEQGNLNRSTLAGEVAVLSGAGGGIGFEAARHLAWLGARVVIAEINKPAGKAAAAHICRQMGEKSALFIHCDAGDERSIRRLSARTLQAYGKVDIVLNNATVAPLGAVLDVAIEDWDKSYRVNLRAPVLLAQAFLPAMLKRRHGTFVTVSSYGSAFMSAYEILKKAQTELSSTLETELADSGVLTFSIGPGVVPTQTYLSSLKKLAPMLGKTEDEFSSLVQQHYLSIEAAGAGFAAAIALAHQFHGCETSSRQALQAAGIEVEQSIIKTTQPILSSQKLAQVLPHIRQVQKTLAQQVEGWKQRSVFEQQWCRRDFKKVSSLSAEHWLELLQQWTTSAAAGDAATFSSMYVPLEKLAIYYGHLREMARGYVKDPQQLSRQLDIIQGWQDEVKQLIDLYGEN